MAESQAMKLGMMLTAAATTLTVAACGGSASRTSRRASGAAARTAAPTGGATLPASTGSAGVTAPATTSTAAGSTAACVASMLSLSYLGGQGATGHGELGFALRNTSSNSCHTFGFPGILFLSNSGQGLTTRTMRTTHDFFGTAPAVRIQVAPGQSVSFRLGVTHGAAPSSHCATASALQVIPPDDTATLKATIPNGGAYECGTVTVSPLRPGTTAYP